MRIFVMGDIHGAHKALLQCFERSHFDYANDRLIALGDVCDGWPEVNLCIDELLKIKHLDYIIGNHDLWAIRWVEEGFQEEIWVEQGGRNTLISYNYKPMPRAHFNFLKKAQSYVEDRYRLFLHAG